ncbi:MAG: hypothetical protein ACYSWP_04325 [Planctomycetota bacterium]|jgi:hypothetical protein
MSELVRLKTRPSRDGKTFKYQIEYVDAVRDDLVQRARLANAAAMGQDFGTRANFGAKRKKLSIAST